MRSIVQPVLCVFIGAAFASATVTQLVPRQEFSCACSGILGTCFSVTELGVTVPIVSCCEGGCVESQVATLPLGGSVSIGVSSCLLNISDTQLTLMRYNIKAMHFIIRSR